MADTDDDLMTDDAKLIDGLLRSGVPEPWWKVAQMAGVDEGYAEEALARMADWPIAGRGQPGERFIDDVAGGTGEDPTGYPIIRRRNLGPDWYEAIEDSTREWRRREAS